MTTWALNVQLGWRVGLAIAVVLVILTAGLAAAAVVLPVAFWTFLLALGAVASVVGAVLVAYRLRGLAAAAYAMDRNALLIHWGWNEHQIPMAAIRGVFSGGELKGLRMQRGLRWPGHYVGYGEAEGVGPILFYATEPPERQVIVRTEEMAYALSPADLEGFLNSLRERLAMGPTQEMAELSVHPEFLDWPIWQDTIGMSFLAGSALLLILLTGMLVSVYPYLPPEIALRVNAGGEALLAGTRARIFYLTLIGLIFLLVNGTLGFVVYARERMGAYFLWGGLLGLEGMLWAAVISILLHQ